MCALESVIKNEDGTFKSGTYVVKKSKKKRANIATDIGVSTEQANKRGIYKNKDGTTNHHSKPPMLEYTNIYQDLLHSLSDIMRSTMFQNFYGRNGITPYTLGPFPNYATEFAGSLSTDDYTNLVPAVRASLVSFPKKKRCPDHLIMLMEGMYQRKL